MNIMRIILIIPSSEKQSHHYILCYTNKIMINVLQKIKEIDGFVLGTFAALFLTIAMILFFATMEGK